MTSKEKQIISAIPKVNDFYQLLHANTGLLIIKIGATWCGPCKRIAPNVERFFASSPDNVICADIDADECVELYSFLKTKRIVNGIPVILCYNKGNVDVFPNDSITGADVNELKKFFARCGYTLSQMQKNITE